MLAGNIYSFQSPIVPAEQGNQPNSLILFLGGDAMTGRGIDQALPHPVLPVLYEQWVKNATGNLNLAEQKSGNIPVPLYKHLIWKSKITYIRYTK